MIPKCEFIWTKLNTECIYSSIRKKTEELRYSSVKNPVRLVQRQMRSHGIMSVCVYGDALFQVQIGSLTWVTVIAYRFVQCNFVYRLHRQDSRRIIYCTFWKEFCDTSPFHVKDSKERVQSMLAIRLGRTWRRAIKGERTSACLQKPTRCSDWAALVEDLAHTNRRRCSSTV